MINKKAFRNLSIIYFNLIKDINIIFLLDIKIYIR